VLEQLEPRIAPVTQCLPDPICALEHSEVYTAAQLQTLPSNTTVTTQATPPPVNTAAIDAALRAQLDADCALGTSNDTIEPAHLRSVPRSYPPSWQRRTVRIKLCGQRRWSVLSGPRSPRRQARHSRSSTAARCHQMERRSPRRQ